MHAEHPDTISAVNPALFRATPAARSWAADSEQRRSLIMQIPTTTDISTQIDLIGAPS
jgi:hypothetical protein